MAKKISFSIVIPTYTGQEHIQKCFESIRQQAYDDISPEVIVVIDGLNKPLRQMVEAQEYSFKELDIPLIIHQFAENRGRFEARKKGAEIAKGDMLLFVDDRVTLGQSFIKKITSDSSSTVMPNVLENSHPNALSKLLYLLRKKIYGKEKWGSNFTSYSITKENFETSPKGTTSLWIKRNTFLKACVVMEENYSSGSLKHSSDDTKLLRIIIDISGSILRRSDVKIFYHPRSRFISELAHIYHRGQLFVDYYLKPGTRFFKHIVLSAVLALIVFSLVIAFPAVLPGILLFLLVITVSISTYIAATLKDALLAVILIPLVALTFGAGALTGIVMKLFR